MCGKSLETAESKTPTQPLSKHLLMLWLWAWLSTHLSGECFGKFDSQIDQTGRGARRGAVGREAAQQGADFGLGRMAAGAGARIRGPARAAPPVPTQPRRCAAIAPCRAAAIVWWRLPPTRTHRRRLPPFSHTATVTPMPRSRPSRPQQRPLRSKSLPWLKFYRPSRVRVEVPVVVAVTAQWSRLGAPGQYPAGLDGCVRGTVAAFVGPWAWRRSRARVL